MWEALNCHEGPVSDVRGAAALPVTIFVHDRSVSSTFSCGPRVSHICLCTVEEDPVCAEGDHASIYLLDVRQLHSSDLHPQVEDSLRMC